MNIPLHSSRSIDHIVLPCKIQRHMLRTRSGTQHKWNPDQARPSAEGPRAPANDVQRGNRNNAPFARTDKDKKDAHKKAIKEKYEENGAKGIIPTSLLTKEALTEWLNDGKTYWQIAEETGASDADVSTMAKLHGLQSTLSKIIAGKKQIKG